MSARLIFGFIALAALWAGGGLVLAARPGPLVLAGVAAIWLAASAAAYAWVRPQLRRLSTISADLAEAADQIATASAQLASANQVLAQGISKQAASVSEVSGSSELMASIMRQSAESSKSAGNLMMTADGLAAEVTQDLDELLVSMQASGAAAAKIAGVTKVVDELAFQTNILSLNAAVEAARAGESGAGFAVVADEVRSLAQRSAEAARDIAALVEESSVKTKEGASRLDRVAEAMRSLIGQTTQVKGLVDELTVSNEELVRGTDQISESMRQLDTIVQTAASSSQETAATGQEMSAQAATMRDLVLGLQTIAGTGRKDTWQ